MIIKESIGCEEQVEPIVKKEQFESKGVAARIGRFPNTVLSKLICCSFKYLSCDNPH